MESAEYTSIAILILDSSASGLNAARMLCRPKSGTKTPAKGERGNGN